MKKIEELETLNSIYEEETRIRKDLERKQIEYLQSLRAEHEGVIDWLRDNEFYFKHPTIKTVATSGPILHEDGRDLYYWSNERGIIKHDLHSDETESTTLLQVIQAGGFMNAVQGIQYVNLTLDDYVKDMKDKNTFMKKELESLSNK